jgi:hypothetical protein
VIKEEDFAKSQLEKVVPLDSIFARFFLGNPGVEMSKVGKSVLAGGTSVLVAPFIQGLLVEKLSMMGAETKIESPKKQGCILDDKDIISIFESRERYWNKKTFRIKHFRSICILETKHQISFIIDDLSMVLLVLLCQKSLASHSFIISFR